MTALVVKCSVPLVKHGHYPNYWYCPMYGPNPGAYFIAPVERGVSAVEVGYGVTWAVGLVLSFWLIGYGVRAGIEMIRRI